MIQEKLQKELVNSLKQKDTQRVLVLRYLISQIKNFEVDLRVEKRELTDEDSMLVLKRQIKRRKKAIEQFRQGNRPDIVEKEEQELEIVQEYFDMFAEETGYSQ